MSTPGLKSFDRVAQVYDETRSAPPHVAAAVTRALLDALHGISDAPHVLEVGIGTGRIAAPLAEAGVRVTGIDISPKMLAVLRQKRGDIDALFAEAAHPPFRGESFDAALFVHILHLVPDAEATVRSVAPLVHGGGVLIRVTDDHDDDGYHVQAGTIMWDVAEAVTGTPRPRDRHAEGAATFERVLRGRGATVETGVVLKYDAPFCARKAIEHMRRRDFSNHWAIPDDAYDAVVAALEHRYQELWGDLDIERPAEKTVRLTVARLP